MPALALSSLEVCSHLLPITDSSRIAFATTTLIAFSVVHASVSESMPKTSDNVPIISQYVNVVMCIIAGSLIEAFLTANCLEKAAGSMPPKWMCLFVINVLGKAVFVRGDRFRKKFAELERMVTQNRQRIIQDRGVNNSPIIRTKRRLITIHYKDDQNNIAYNHDRSPALFDSRLQ